MYRKILVPLDGSGRAEAILPHVENIAERFGAHVIILMVEEPATMLALEEVVNAGRFLEERAQIRKGIATYAARIIKKLQKKNIEAELMTRTGPVVQSIVKTAARENIDLVAMASHGRSGLARTFYGSVAAGVLQNIDRPILMIRSRRADAPTYI